MSVLQGGSISYSQEPLRYPVTYHAALTYTAHTYIATCHHSNLHQTCLQNQRTALYFHHPYCPVQELMKARLQDMPPRLNHATHLLLLLTDSQTAAAAVYVHAMACLPSTCTVCFTYVGTKHPHTVEQPHDPLQDTTISSSAPCHQTVIQSMSAASMYCHPHCLQTCFARQVYVLAAPCCHSNSSPLTAAAEAFRNTPKPHNLEQLGLSSSPDRLSCSCQRTTSLRVCHLTRTSSNRTRRSQGSVVCDRLCHIEGCSHRASAQRGCCPGVRID